MMAAFWPTPQAAQMLPDVAADGGPTHKLVVRATLDTVAWQNTTRSRAIPRRQVRQLKEQPGPDIVILGSGSIVSQLTEARLIDEYQIRP